MNQIILSNQIRCLDCGDEPFSGHRHDFKFCDCGSVAVDGGTSYLRRLGTNFMELSIVIDELTFVTCLSALEWCEETKRNDFGRLCAIFRALRDTGFLEENK